MPDHVATASTHISASPKQVWHALTDPEAVAAYMFGARVETDWQEGSPISWRGEWEGKPYEDRGEVVEARPGSRLVVTHFSPLSGAEDRPESYHRVTYELRSEGDGTVLSLSQDGNGSAEEAEQARETWSTMLGLLKEYVERG